jgi:hypothetical protein
MKHPARHCDQQHWESPDVAEGQACSQRERDGFAAYGVVVSMKLLPSPLLQATSIEGPETPFTFTLTVAEYPHPLVIATLCAPTVRLLK